MDGGAAAKALKDPFWSESSVRKAYRVDFCTSMLQNGHGIEDLSRKSKTRKEKESKETKLIKNNAREKSKERKLVFGAYHKQ